VNHTLFPSYTQLHNIFFFKKPTHCRWYKKDAETGYLASITWENYFNRPTCSWFCHLKTVTLHYLMESDTI